MKEQNQTPEKELNEMGIANLPDAEFKTLVIRTLKEIGGCCNSIKEEMRFTLHEIKKNLQGTNGEEEEAGIQINDLEHKEEISSTRAARRKKESKNQG